MYDVLCIPNFVLVFDVESLRMDFVFSGLVHFARQKVFWRSGKEPSFVPSRGKLSFVVVVCSNALQYSCFSGSQGVLCTSVTLSKRNLVNSVVC